MKFWTLLLFSMIAFSLSKPVCCVNCGNSQTSTSLQDDFDPDCYKKPICSYDCPCNRRVFFEMKGEAQIQRYDEVCTKPKQLGILRVFKRHFDVAYRKIQKEFRRLIGRTNGNDDSSETLYFENMRNIIRKSTERHRKRGLGVRKLGQFFRDSTKIRKNLFSFLPLIKRLCQGKGYF